MGRSPNLRDRGSLRMLRAVCLVPLLGLVSAWTPQAAPVMEKSPTLTQEKFDLKQFMGRWYEVAVVSTCPYYMQRKSGNPVIVALDLKNVPSERNFTMTAFTFGNGSCRETSTDYSSTNFPGRFFHHVARFGADVDSSVVHTNYDDYAMILQLSTEKPSGNKTTTVKLYSRTKDVDPPVLNQFKTLVRKHGMNNDAIIINQHSGECVPGGQVKEPATQSQTFVSKRSKRNMRPPVTTAEEVYADI